MALPSAIAKIRLVSGFFLASIPWYVGVFILLFVATDYREKPGLVVCTVAVSGSGTHSSNPQRLQISCVLCQEFVEPNKATWKDNCLQAFTAHLVVLQIQLFKSEHLPFACNVHGSYLQALQSMTPSDHSQIQAQQRHESVILQGSVPDTQTSPKILRRPTLIIQA
ncbi:hypothetical protein C4D60_Mb02t20830 [Musa balbisiana]|uniref:Uncharacterized protein n=1 Tax=Musa balbisiana TaxID=52838 RepID=A0A4S8IC73_MUSBA|nr:hypothetical protein C4D60_Mb02t20830 [Musa balbisiana]